MHSDSKKHRSVVALFFVAGDVRRLVFMIVALETFLESIDCGNPTESK